MMTNMVMVTAEPTTANQNDDGTKKWKKGKKKDGRHSKATTPPEIRKGGSY